MALSWHRSICTFVSRGFRTSGLAIALLFGIAGVAKAAPIAFVQSNAASPQASQATVTITYLQAQSVGNLNVVVVGWNDATSTVSSVVDSNGNVYALAAPPVVQAATATQAIYYAKNITAAAAGANTVTVTFNAAARFPDIRIAEYSGLDTVNPLDVSAGAQGNTGTSDSGPATTTNANDLLIGANTVQSSTTAAGTGFTSRGITVDGDILEDRVVTVTGNYNATAALDKVQPWIMQVVAFRAAPSGSTAPSITSLTPTSGPAGTAVVIAGANFGASQGTSTVTFNGTATSPTNWSATSITASVPSGATSGNVVVTVGGVASNGVNFTVGSTPTIAFVQTNSTAPQATQTPVALPYTLAQTAGNLNVVIVGWNDSTATVTSVTDTVGNSYSLAAAPVVQSGTASQAIYYAKNIGAAAAGANFVTVNFSVAARHPDIRIAEYRGLDTVNPLDAAAGAQGNTTTSDSGPAATTNANDLLVAGNTVQSTTTGAGPGFTSRGITTDGDILEDQIVSATGNYNATALLDKTQLWIMQVAAFRAAVGGGGGAAPAITSLNPTSGYVGTSVTITGSNFGATQGTSSVSFNGIIATPTGWGPTTITVPVPGVPPQGGVVTTGPVVVTVNGVASNAVTFTVLPSITGLSPSTAVVGTSIIVSGTAFGNSQGTSTVTFNGVVGTPTQWVPTFITVPVPVAATTGNVVVTVGGVSSNGALFSVTPNISSLINSFGPVGSSITINGTGFGSAQGSSTVAFNGTVGSPTAWSSTSITVPVPAGATTGNVVVTVGGVASNGVAFTVSTSAPSITNLNPISGPVSTSVTITGANFGATQGTSTVTFNGTAATPTNWSATSITVPVPAGATTGNVVVTVSSIASNGVAFTVTVPAPTISNLSPISGPTGTSVTITGTNFGATQGTSTVTFNGLSSTPSSWSATSIIAPVPTGATSGNVVVTVGGVASNGVSFTVQSGSAGIKLVQHAGKDAGSTTSSSLAFPSSNTTGNWIAVTIRAGRSSQVFTVTDTSGNTYRKAVQFNVTADTPNGDTLAIFYAENIAGGANTVTVSDTIGGSTLRFAILEYSGVATANSLDVSTASQGTGASLNSGTVTTTSPGDLLLGALVTSNGQTYSAGAGYTAEDRVPGSPSTKLMDEDQIQSAAGAASATATIGASDIWAAALAAFKTAGGGISVPSITSLNPTSGAVGTAVTISGSNFGASQGTSTVTFNGTAASPTSWSAASIVVPVPTGATTGSVVVTVGGAASNAVGFTVTLPAPSITTLSPTSGAIGISVTISGSNFGASQGTSTVTFNGVAAAPTSWSSTSIVVPVPNGATTGNVLVTVNGVASNGVTFTVTSTSPSISTLSNASGPVGSSITITGLNFGATQGSSTVTFNGTQGVPTSWSATSITLPVPSGATTGNVVVTVGGAASNGVLFTVTPPPSITGISPSAGPVGTVVNVTGTNFGATVGTRTSLVTFNGTAARPNSWSDTLIVVPVPAGATTGNVVVSIGGVASNGVNFTVTAGPNIASVNPAAGTVGSSVTISGAGFGASQGTSTLTFNGTAATPTSWSDTSIVAPVPTGATSGNVVVTANGIASNGVPFTVNTGGIKLVQHAGKDAGTTTSSTLAFPANNTAGDWIAVVIRAGKSGQVFTVSDSHSNVYKQAFTLNMTVDLDTIAIYYAENIAGGANTVTVSDTVANGTLRFAILEYSGVALSNSLDAVISSQGNGSTASSGSTVAAWGGDLLLGEIVTANPATYTAGAGYKIEDFVPAEPNTKLIDEDQTQATAGTISANATLAAPDAWGAAIAAFKAANGTPPPPASVSVSPTTASVAASFGTQNFTATVTNDVQSKGVTWALSGSGCSGATCGTLTNVTSTSVTYNGPSAIPSPATVTLTATSVADNTKSSAATITVVQGPLTVFVSPKRGSITMSQTQQFTATVFNDPSNAGVTWQVDSNTGGNATSGTISTTGLFVPGTQPGLHTITATSVTNASVNRSVSFAVTDLQGVYMHHNDAARTGQNLKEYALTPANVNSSTFTLLFSCPVDGQMYAEPLYVANLTFGATKHNVVYVATEHDSVYAFDADSSSCTQLWKISFLGTGVSTMPWGDTSLGTPFGPTNDIFPEIGITSTPVIDPATNTIYVEAKTKETVGTGCSSGSPCYVNRLHALDLITGAEKFGGPVVISAPNFVSLRHFNRPALLLANNTVYVSFGSHGDISPWYGWLFGYDAATLTQKFVFSTSDATGSASNGASIWSGGAGPAADASGNIYFSTGNGTFDGRKNFSESVIKLSPTGTLLDFFTPFNQNVFDANDIDLASAGVMILPDAVGSTAHPHLLMATGKVAILYLLDQNNLGKFNSTTNQDVQEVIPVPPPNTTQLDGGIYGLPAYWNGKIYSTGQNFPLSQFSIANGVMATPQTANSTNTFPPRGAIPAVSASGTTNGVVWILDLSAWASNGNAILDAYDATNVTQPLFTSPTSGTGSAGAAVKFTVPTVANGKVYVGGQSSFSVFGLLP